MDVMKAVMIIEGVEDADEDTVIEAWQLLHDTGVAYQLQGSTGRMCARLVEQGVINA